MSNQDKGEALKELSDEELMRELARRRAERGPKGMWDFEEAVEASQREDGRAMHESYFEQRSREYGDVPRPCPRCGMLVRVRVRDRERPVRTMSGEVTLRRHYHYCESCKHGFYPLDGELGLEPDSELTPKLSARLLDFALHSPFGEAANRWRLHHTAEASERLMRDVAERAGQRIERMQVDELQSRLRATPKETANLLVVQTDGSMLPMRGKDSWREAKLGVVYRDEHHLAGSDDKRGAITQARYTATVGDADRFREGLASVLRIERADKAKTVVWLGDGAPMNWNSAEELCPHAVQVLDWAHAVEKAADCAKVVLGEASPWVRTWTDTVATRLRLGHIDDIIIEIARCRDLSRGEARQALDDLHRYYTTHRERMRYDEFRRRGLPIGSGVVESGHRHVLQKRMKLAGQHWHPDRADRMAKLRAAYKTSTPEAFNDVIRLAA